jgi:RNA polymerase II subunit A small phosphatase-like protein
MAESVITQVRKEDDTRRVSIQVQPVIAEPQEPEKRGCCSFFQCFGSSPNDQEQERQRTSAQSLQVADVRSSMGPVHLLPSLGSALRNRKCLVIDLDETLVHSNFKFVQDADFVVPVEIDGTVHRVYVLKRPGCDEFLRRVGALYEIVIFTASLAKYANPVLDLLDIHKVVHFRLFREACVNYDGNFVKDLSRLGRELKNVIIIDNSSTSYMLQPRNAIPIKSWFDEKNDEELIHLANTLEDMADVPNTDGVLPSLRELQIEMSASYNDQDAPHWSNKQLSFSARRQKRVDGSIPPQ